ncbi:MAG: LysE family transporter [Psychromonas sp.]|nr:LysE family transporter [Psychromonas sp.]
MLATEFLSTYIPTALPVLLLAHLLALISPGPDLFIVTGHAVRGRFNGSLFICFGICLANAVYIIIAMLGWSALAQLNNLLVVMQMIGAIYLTYVGYMLITSHSKALNSTSVNHRLSYKKQFITGFTSAILNPKNMIFYFSLTGLLLGEQSTSSHKITASICMILMVLFYNLLLVKLIGLPTFTRFLENKINLFEKVAGVMLLLIALMIVKNIVL